KVLLSESMASRNGLPYFVVTTDLERPGVLGNAYYKYAYSVNGREYSSSERSFRLVLEERIATESPKEFLQGVWFMNMTRNFTDHDATAHRLLEFYKQVGFNSIWGVGGPSEYSSAKELGLLVVRSGSKQYCANGYAFMATGELAQQLTEEEQFRFHPNFERYGQRYLRPGVVCPEVLASEEFFPHIKESALRNLRTADHLYENWEPYMFQKRGCVCGRCRRAFRQFAGMTDEQVSAIWPDCVVDLQSEIHSRFASHQIARVHRVLQRALREASREMGRTIPAGFVPAISPKEFDPEQDRHYTNGAKEYVRYLDMFTIWGMPFDVNLGVVNLQRMVGHNLRFLPAIERTLELVGEHGRKQGDRRLPRVCNVSGIHFVGLDRFAMPKVYYFQTVMNFLQGMDGHSSYHEAGVDARFIRLRAKAARIMAAYEQMTLHGARRENYRAEVVSPSPTLPDRDILYSISHERDGERIIALGNDYYKTIYVRLAIDDLGTANAHWLVDRINGRIYGGETGYSRADLGRGVLIDIPSKEFRILEIHAGGHGVAAADFELTDEAAVAADYSRQRQDLLDHARFLESLGI
ncbi:MAG: hypothetical protein ACE5JM_15590, partial [Armatimonadota bacterium]